LIVSLLLVTSIIVNVCLATRVRSLLSQDPGPAGKQALKAGTLVPPLTVNRLDGKSAVINYSSADEPTVLYVFRPGCSWCARNLPNLAELIEKAGSSYRFVGLSLTTDGLERYVADNHLEFPIYSNLSAEARRVYGLGGTPQTIVISPEGRVMKNWLGAYVGGQKSQVEGFFRVSLPGLAPSLQ